MATALRFIIISSIMSIMLGTGYITSGVRSHTKKITFCGIVALISGVLGTLFSIGAYAILQPMT